MVVQIGIICITSQERIHIGLDKLIINCVWNVNVAVFWIAALIEFYFFEKTLNGIIYHNFLENLSILLENMKLHIGEQMWF